MHRSLDLLEQPRRHALVYAGPVIEVLHKRGGAELGVRKGSGRTQDMVFALPPPPPSHLAGAVRLARLVVLDPLLATLHVWGGA